MIDGLKEAGMSVRRRGFLEGPTAPSFYDAILMSQVGRLSEEVGEFARSLRDDDGPSVSELADVVIVCAAIADYMDWELSMAIKIKCQVDEEKRGYLHGHTVHVDSMTVNGDG